MYSAIDIPSIQYIITGLLFEFNRFRYMPEQRTQQEIAQRKRDSLSINQCNAINKVTLHLKKGTVKSEKHQANTKAIRIGKLCPW